MDPKERPGIEAVEYLHKIRRERDRLMHHMCQLCSCAAGLQFPVVAWTLHLVLADECVRADNAVRVIYEVPAR